MSYDDRKSTWNGRVRKAIRRGSAEEEVRKHRDRVTTYSNCILSRVYKLATSLHVRSLSHLSHFPQTCITADPKERLIKVATIRRLDELACIFVKKALQKQGCFSNEA